MSELKAKNVRIDWSSIPRNGRNIKEPVPKGTEAKLFPEITVTEGNQWSFQKGPMDAIRVVISCFSLLYGKLMSSQSSLKYYANSFQPLQLNLLTMFKTIPV